MIPAICSIGRNFVGFWERETAYFALNELLDVPDRSQMTQLLVINRHLQHFLDENDNLHHRQRVDAQILDQPKIIVRIPELRPEIRLHKPLDNAQNDRRQMFGILGLAKL